jgi:hypothetical protein
LCIDYYKFKENISEREIKLIYFLFEKKTVRFWWNSLIAFKSAIAIIGSPVANLDSLVLNATARGTSGCTLRPFPGSKAVLCH